MKGDWTKRVSKIGLTNDMSYRPFSQVATAHVLLLVVFVQVFDVIPSLVVKYHGDLLHCSMLVSLAFASLRVVSIRQLFFADCGLGRWMRGHISVKCL